MSELPSLTEAAIRARANDKSWARGSASYEDNCVCDIIWRDGSLYADVVGNDYDPYHVHVTFIGAEIVDASCTCPYNWGGDCKHIVALLLSLVHGTDKIAARPAIGELVAKLSRDQLISLFIEMADRHPELTDEIERIAPAAGGGETADADAGPSASALPPVDLDLLRRQIAADMRDSIQTGYDS